MKYENLQDYISNLKSKGLTKIEVAIEVNEDDGEDYVTKSKETYTCESEIDADNLINEARRLEGFAAVTKKFKQGKYNKQGDEIRPDCYIVTLKFDF